MQSSKEAFEKIKDKLTPRQRIVLLYAGRYDNQYQRSIEEVAQLLGVNKEFILLLLKGALKQFPNEVSTILNLRKS